MLAAVVTVLAIIAVIVMGLAAFRARDPGTVSLSTRPSRVEVSVDGRALGSSMSPFVIGELTPDRPHEIVVSSAGHAPWTKTLTLSPGQVMTLTDVVLEPIETDGMTLDDLPALKAEAHRRIEMAVEAMRAEYDGVGAGDAA